MKTGGGGGGGLGRAEREKPWYWLLGKGGLKEVHLRGGGEKTVEVITRERPRGAGRLITNFRYQDYQRGRGEGAENDFSPKGGSEITRTLY